MNTEALNLSLFLNHIFFIKGTSTDVKNDKLFLGV